MVEDYVFKVIAKRRVSRTTRKAAGVVVNLAHMPPDGDELDDLYCIEVINDDKDGLVPLAKADAVIAAIKEMQKKAKEHQARPK